MKYKTDKGIQVELSDADIMQISKHNKSDFNGNKLNEYFHQMKDEAVKKLEHISNKMIVDEKDVYTNLAYVLKNGTSKDAADYIKYAVDYDISKHIIDSMKNN